MITSDFTYLLCQPLGINSDKAQELELMLKEFPYFQPARALYLKALFNQKNFKYNTELKISAVYTTDRSILFNFITSKIFKSISTNDLNKIEALKEIFVSNYTVLSKQNIKTNIATSSLEESIIKSIIQADKTSFQPVENYTIDLLTIETNTKIQDTLPHNTDNNNRHQSSENQSKKVVEFNPEEAHSFTQWLKLTKMQPIDRSDEDFDETNTQEQVTNKFPSVLNSSVKENKFKLIDKFIENNPKIVAVKNSTIAPVNIEKSTEEKSYLMTETLAKIYLEQKKYHKAIQAYEILILKYPEKSSLFAERIKEIKKNQNNNN